MAKKISELTELSSITGNDFIEVSEDNGAGGYNSKKFKPKTAANHNDSEYVHTIPNTTVQALTCADAVTVNWALGSIAIMTFDRAAVAFTFSGAYNGQKCMLVLKQSASGGNTANFGAEVRGSADLPLPITLSTGANKKDRLGFIYDGDDEKYDFIAINKGF